MIYVTSDLHGCGVEILERLLEKADFGPEDYLFVLGDVIDRGDHGAELLLWLTQQPNMQLILGNHEAMLMACKFLFDEVTEESLAYLTGEKLKVANNWFHNGGYVTMNGLARLQREDPELLEGMWEYLDDAPLYEMLEVSKRKFLLVHSGLDNYEKGKPIEDYSVHDLLWARPHSETKYEEDYIVIFGHTPTEFFGQQYKGRWCKGHRWVCIDTGAAMGGTPMLMRLEDGKSWYID